MTPTQLSIAIGTMMRKETIRIFRIWSQTLLPPVITTALYFAVFWAFLGSRIGDIWGVPYKTYIIPWLVMLGVISSAFSNVATVTFMAKFQKFIEEILVSPMPPWAIWLGFVSGGVIRGSIIATIIISVSLFFVDVPFKHPGIIFLSIIGTTLFFASMGLINGLLAKDFDGISIIPNFILTPLTYLGGVFYSLDHLPETWKFISYANPIVYIVDLFRYGFLGTLQTSLPLSLSVLIGGCILFAWIGLWMLQNGKGLRG